MQLEIDALPDEIELQFLIVAFLDVSNRQAA